MAKGFVENFVDSQPWLDSASDAIQPVINNLFNSTSQAGRVAKDALNGVWLGHSLHSAISDVPVGAWTTAQFLDVLSAGRGDDPGLDNAADFAVGLGVAGGVAAAITGWTDWSEIGGTQRRMGLLHALMNVTGLLLNTGSLIMRLSGGNRGTARSLSAAGYVASFAAAYVGGDLVYRKGQAVSRDAWIDGPDKYTDIAASAELADGKMHKYDVNNVSIVLIRHGDGLHAFAGTCPHFGGPLWEGKLDGHCVTCPWHGSQFDISDGRLLHGPSTHPIPCYDVRERNGRVEIRLEGTAGA